LQSSLQVNNSLESGLANGSATFACFGISTVSPSALQYCYGTILIYTLDGDPAGSINVQGSFPPLGAISPFSIAITGGTGYYLNAFGAITGMQSANGLQWWGTATVSLGPKPTSAFSVYEAIDNPLVEANTTIGSIQVFSIPVLDSYYTGNTLGQDHQLSIDLSTNGNGSVVCMQVISFINPSTGGVTGQIYYQGIFPPFFEEGYVLLSIVGGTGSYAGAEGQLLNGQNVGGFSYQYHLWYTAPPPFTATQVQYTSTLPPGVVFPPPAPEGTTTAASTTSTTPTPSTGTTPTPTTGTTPTPSSANVANNGTTNGAVSVAAIVIAVVAFVLLVVLAVLFFRNYGTTFGEGAAAATPKRATTVQDDSDVNLETPRV